MEDNQVVKHICGVCKDEWLSEQEYLNHTCPNTQLQPTEPGHLINSTTPDFAEISAAALERGAADVAAATESLTVDDPNLQQPPAEQTPDPGVQPPTINLG